MINYVKTGPGDFMLEALKDKDVVMEVVFNKVDGTNRVMLCTQALELIPEDKHPTGESKTVYDDNQIRVFDLEVNEWRSFRKDSIISTQVRPL